MLLNDEILPQLRRFSVQINGISHHPITPFIRVQVITAICRPQKMQGPPRIAHHRVKVNDRVEFPAVPDPMINGLPRCFVSQTVIK